MYGDGLWTPSRSSFLRAFRCVRGYARGRPVVFERTPPVLQAYTEKGYTLTRSLEALALQASDWGAASNLVVQIHVLVIFDGFNVVDDTMWAR